MFAVLFGATVFLIRTNIPEGVQKSTGWLNTQHGGLVAATALMPFAGISFLWFIGVVRDGLGRFEDRFFASVFLGSGLLFLAMTFVAAAVVAGLVASNAGVIESPARAEVIDLGRFIVLAATKTYAIRMAAVFMMSLATIWLKNRPDAALAGGDQLPGGGWAADRRRHEHVGCDGLPGLGTGGQCLDPGSIGTVRGTAERIE